MSSLMMDSLKNDKIKEVIKEMIHTIADILYNDVFFYICIICIYNISSFIIILAILYFCTHLRFYITTNTTSYTPATTPHHHQLCPSCQRF